MPAAAKPLKVLFVMPLAYRHGGAENILWTYLRRADRSRIEPVVVFFEEGTFPEEVAALGIRTYVLRPADSPRPRIARFSRRLARVVRRERPQLIFSWLVEAQPFSGVAALMTGNWRRVVWWQGNMPRADFWEHVATALPSRAVFLYSHATATAQREIWPHRNTVVVHPGIDRPPRLDEGAREALRRRLRLPADRPVIGIVGRLCSWKGQHHVLRALALLRERGHDVHGLLVGGNAYDFEPEYEPYLRCLTAELELEPHVTFTGQVDDGTRYVQLMDVAINASDPEPFGIVLLEAMALDIPVVAVNSGGPGEIIEHGRSGLLVSSADGEQLAGALSELVASPARRRELAEGGRRRFEACFTTERMVEQLTRELERIERDASGG